MDLKQKINQTRNELDAAENKLNHLYNYNADEVKDIVIEIWGLELELELQLERSIKQ